MVVVSVNNVDLYHNETTLSPQQFKALWAALPTAGSFEARIASMPVRDVDIGGVVGNDVGDVMLVRWCWW
jgi:hypothetical protein